MCVCVCVAGEFHLGAHGRLFRAVEENDEQQAEKKCSGPFFLVEALAPCEAEGAGTRRRCSSQPCC